MGKIRAYYTTLFIAKALQDDLDAYVSVDPDFWVSTYRNDTYILLLIHGDDDDHSVVSAIPGIVDSGVADIRTDTQLTILNFSISTAVSAFPFLLVADFDSALDIGDAITVIMRHLEPGAPALSYDNTPLPSGTFTDDFTGTDGELLEDRTGWVLAQDGAYNAEIYNNGLTFQSGGGGSGGSTWTGTDQGSADQYVQIIDSQFVAFWNDVYLAVRLVDKDNYIGYHLAGTGGTGARLCKRVAGVLTDSIISTQGASGYGFKIECEGNTIRLYKDTGSGFAQVGTDQTITDFNTETSAGFVSREATAATTIKWDDFENGLVGSPILPINVTGEVQFSGVITRKRSYKRSIGGSI